MLLRKMPGVPALAKGRQAMLDVLVFAVVAVALATPFIVPILWGQIEKTSASFDG
jgi:ABC-type phosphate/phosphonate transport system permease subunit